MNLGRLAAIIGILAALLAGCGGSPDPSDANTLTVMAGSEVKDLEPLLPDIRSKTGVSLVMSYSGTLEGAEAIGAVA